MTSWSNRKRSQTQLSILSKINEELEKQLDGIREKSFNSIQDQQLGLDGTLGAEGLDFQFYPRSTGGIGAGAGGAGGTFQFYPRSTL